MYHIEVQNMKAVLIREFEEPKVIELTGKSGELQEIIGGWIDIVRRRIGASNTDYLIVCDDEGILKGRSITAKLDGEPALVGDLIIVKPGDSEDFAPLTDYDVDNILGATERVLIDEGNEFFIKYILSIKF